jgi:hypothetical protein
MLSKPVCDKYLEMRTYMAGLEVFDAPCFFNGPDDGCDYHCVTQSLLIEGTCGDIKTNSIIIDDERKEMRSCIDAPTLFGWSFTCLWLWSDSESKHFCTTVYFLSENSLLCFHLIFYCY